VREQQQAIIRRLQRLEHLVWFGATQSQKGLKSQWVNAAFWTVWVNSITDAFETLGMEDLLVTILGTNFKTRERTLNLGTLFWSLANSVREP